MTPVLEDNTPKAAVGSACRHCKLPKHVRCSFSMHHSRLSIRPFGGYRDTKFKSSKVFDFKAVTPWYISILLLRTGAGASDTPGKPFRAPNAQFWEQTRSCQHSAPFRFKRWRIPPVTRTGCSQARAPRRPLGNSVCLARYWSRLKLSEGSCMVSSSTWPREARARRRAGTLRVAFPVLLRPARKRRAIVSRTNRQSVSSEMLTLSSLT